MPHTIEIAASGRAKCRGPWLEALPHDELEDSDLVASAAEFGIGRRRWPRVNGAERAVTGLARSRPCRELIERQARRISFVFFDEFRLRLVFPGHIDESESQLSAHNYDIAML